MKGYNGNFGESAIYRRLAADIVITGVRRCGKSCLMETIVKELEETGVPKENIIYSREQ